MNAAPGELEIGAHTYFIGKLNPFQQLHVARRVGPITAAMGLSVAELARRSTAAGTDDHGDAMTTAIAAAMEVMSKMTDDEVNYILHTCLGVVTRKDPESGRGAKVWTPSGMMFQDIDLPVMVQLTIAVLRENLAGFFQQLTGGNG